MNPEIEKLIEMALVDGQVTDKEREIILRKADKLGLDVDEVEMYLEGKIGVSIKPKNLSENLNFISDEVTIGNQIWMTKNLNVDRFRNGDPIPYAKYDLDWIEAIKNKKPVYGYYENNPNNEFKYGKIYNWFAVNDERGLAPDGWKIPTIEEWEILINFNGGDQIAGEKMKSNSENWKDFGFGDNSSGLLIEPGGIGNCYEVLRDGDYRKRGWYLDFERQGEEAHFFSSSHRYEKNFEVLIKLGGDMNTLWISYVGFVNYGRNVINSTFDSGNLQYVRCLKK
jgi:uncharacterized protein (TIGR02145 family)